MRTTALVSALLLGTAMVCGPAACKNAGGTERAQAGQGSEVGIVLASMDKTADPGDDFYAYANGNWMKTTEIPADRPSIGGFTIADQATEKNLEALLAGIVGSDPAVGSGAGRVKAYYQAYLDTKAIDAAGMAPIKPDLDRIE
ncbi:MAG: M13 family metallopeptidase N-terminal domain-containing protein, partial [Novosphingobium sp.]